MDALLGQCLLGLSAAALAHGGWLLWASRLDAVAAAIAAVATAAAVAVLEMLALSMVSLADSRVALVAAALAWWLGVRRVVGPSVRAPINAPTPLAWTLIGVLVAWTAYGLWRPALGYDGITYHLPEAATWALTGQPGTPLLLFYDAPVGYFPLNDEVLLSWALGLSRSMATVVLWPSVALALLLASVWRILRELRVPVGIGSLAIASIATLPMVMAQLAGPNNDLPSTAWLAACFALVAASRREPRALLPAALALGLAVGTKTTTLPLGAAACLLAVMLHRGGLWRTFRRPPTGVAYALAAVILGGLWYARNAAVHGSPLWPFIVGPWGTPPPSPGESTSLLAAPRETLSGRLGDYRFFVSGGLPLLAGAMAAAVASRCRWAFAAAGALGLLVLLWAAAPLTGVDERNVGTLGASLASLRYLLPTIVLATVVLAVLTARTRVRPFGWVMLSAALAMNLYSLPHIAPSGPAWVALLGVGLGIGMAWVAPRVRPRAVVPVAVVLAVTVPAAAVDGFTLRHADHQALLPYTAALRFVSAHDAGPAGHAPVRFGGVTLGVFAGDRLQHPVSLLQKHASCESVNAATQTGWVVVDRVLARLPATHPRGFTAGRCLVGSTPAHRDGRYAVYGGSGG